MDPVTLPFVNQPNPPDALGEVSRTNQLVHERRKVQAAKEFESLLIARLVDSMKETVGESGLLEEEGSEQIRSMFWMNLSSAISDQGGIGLWKEIYKNIYGAAPSLTDAASERPQELDKTI